MRNVYHSDCEFDSRRLAFTTSTLSAGTVMPMKPPAIGYLRRDISGVAQPWDETQIRSLAERLGYRFTKTVAFSDRTTDPLGRLLAVVASTAAVAVVTPSLAHLDDLPEAVLAACDIVTVTPEITHSRTLPALPA